MEEKELKKTKKMEAAIARCEKKWGELERDYWIEHDPRCRHKAGYYDGCDLTCKIIQSLLIRVTYDGKINKM